MVDEISAGVYPYTDSGSLTILNQKMNGLEIQLKDGEWFQVDTSDSIFAVLVSDAFTVTSLYAPDHDANYLNI